MCTFAPTVQRPSRDLQSAQVDSGAEMTALDAELYRSLLSCHVLLQTALVDSGAEMTQAVDNMLELVPTGMHKWVGMDVLLQALQLEASQVGICLAA